MLRDDLAGADLRRLRHGDLSVIPRGCHHAGCVVLKLPDGAPHHVPYTVDEPHGKGAAIFQPDLGSFLRDKLRLCRHDGTAAAALGQFVPRPFAAIYIFNIRNDLRLHETLDKSGLSGAHRAYYAYVNIPRGSSGDILINGIHHDPVLFCCSVMLYSMSVAQKV